MKKIIVILLFPIFCNAQKSYNVTGISSEIDGLKNLGIGKTKITVIVTDSTFTQVYDGKETVYQIVKKVSDNYFKMSDGLKEYVVRITEEKYKKYTGVIVQETDQGKMYLWYN